MDYKDMSLKQFQALAENSSGEIAALDNKLFNYETGQFAYLADEDTNMFLASARSIVLELVRRCKAYESELGFIHSIAYEDLRTDEGGSGTWSIEAIAAKAIGLTDEQRDNDFPMDARLFVTLRELGKEYDNEVLHQLSELFKPDRGE